MSGQTRGWYIVLERPEVAPEDSNLVWAATLIPNGLCGMPLHLAMASVEWMLAESSPRLAEHWWVSKVYGRRSWIERMENALTQGPLDFPIADFVRQVETKSLRRRGLRLARLLSTVPVGGEIGLSQVVKLFPPGPSWDRHKASSWLRLVPVKKGFFEVSRPGSSVRGRSVEPLFRRVR